MRQHLLCSLLQRNTNQRWLWCWQSYPADSTYSASAGVDCFKWSQRKHFYWVGFWWSRCVWWYTVEAVSNMNDFEAVVVINELRMPHTNNWLMDYYWMHNLIDEKHSTSLNSRKKWVNHPGCVFVDTRLLTPTRTDKVSVCVCERVNEGMIEYTK